MAEDQATTPDTAPEAVDTKPAQDVKIQDAGPAKKTLTITIPEDRIKDAIEGQFARLRSDANIPGFRRGRAPRRLVEKRFGENVREEVKNQILGETYSQAIDEHDLEVIGNPDVKDIDSIELPESGDLTFVVDIEVTPDVDLPEFSSLEVKKRSTEVTDADVDQEIEKFRERMGRMEPVQDEGATVDYSDFIQGDARILKGEDAGDDAEVISEHPGTYVMVNGEDKEFKGHVAGIVVEDLGKRLHGKKVGDVERVSTTGPSQHENEDLRDQPITIEVKVESIVRLTPAPIEQLQQQMGVETEDEMKERAKQMLQQRAEQRQVQDQHQQILDQLMEKIELELPEAVTGNQSERIIRRQAMEMAYRGASEQDIEAQMAEMRSGSAEQAAKELKQFFILDKAAKDLEVQVDENELNGQISMMAMQQGRRPEKFRQELQRQGRLEQMYLQMREHKTLDKILEQAKVEESDEKVIEKDAEQAEG